MKNFPTLSRTLTAFKKAGAEVKRQERRGGGREENSAYRSYVATKGNNRITFNTQEGFPDKNKIEVSLFCMPSDQTDVQTDCFCDYFPYNLKNAVKCLGYNYL